MIARTLWQFVRLAVAAAGGWWLTVQVGPLLGGVVWGVGSAAACVLGCVLLRTSAVGRVTWKNRVAGWLIPWGWRLTAGKLWPVAVASWVVWVLVWAAVAVLTPPPAQPPSAWGVAERVLLAAAWAVDGLALGYIVGTIRQHASSSSGGRSLRVIAVVIAVLVGGSVALHLFGWTMAGLVVAGGPPLLAGVGYGVFVAVLLVFGRNSRWN